MPRSSNLYISTPSVCDLFRRNEATDVFRGSNLAALVEGALPRVVLGRRRELGTLDGGPVEARPVAALVLHVEVVT